MDNYLYKISLCPVKGRVSSTRVVSIHNYTDKVFGEVDKVMLLVVNTQWIPPHPETPYYTPFEPLTGYVKWWGGPDLAHRPWVWHLCIKGWVCIIFFMLAPLSQSSAEKGGGLFKFGKSSYTYYKKCFSFKHETSGWPQTYVHFPGNYHWTQWTFVLSRHVCGCYSMLLNIIQLNIFSVW